jgi:hypothetical protein
LFIFIRIINRISSVAKRQDHLQEKGETAETTATLVVCDETPDKPEAAVQKPVIREGFKKGTLQKQSQIIKTLSQRYFVLNKEDKKLYYYRASDDPTFEKSIELSADCKVIMVDKNKFDLETEARTYKFIAESEEERNSWTSSLLLIISYNYR